MAEFIVSPRVSPLEISYRTGLLPASVGCLHPSLALPYQQVQLLQAQPPVLLSAEVAVRLKNNLLGGGIKPAGKMKKVWIWCTGQEWEMYQRIINLGRSKPQFHKIIADEASWRRPGPCLTSPCRKPPAYASWQ